MEMIDRDAAIERLNSFFQAQLEYEESHQDAGNNYAHMPYESWGNDSERRLVEQFDAITTVDYTGINWRDVTLFPAIDTKGLDVDLVADLALNNFEMRPGSVYGMYDSAGWIVLDCYPVSEIEIQFDPAEFGIGAELFADIKSYLDAYISDSGLAYMTTDAAWYHAIKRDVLQTLIDDRVSD